MGLSTLIKKGIKRYNASRNRPKLNVRWKSNKSKPTIIKSWSYNPKTRKRTRGGF